MAGPECSWCFEPTRTISILGTPIAVKRYCCSRDGSEYRPKCDPIQLQLTILPTRLCDAHCPFCIAAPTDDPRRLDPARLEDVLRRLKREDRVRGVSISGGEPCLDMALLDRIVHMVFEILGADAEVSLNTNGAGLRALKGLRDLYGINAIHISRHHWDDRVNDRVFRRAMPTAQELRSALREIACPELFVLNCMLLKDGVCRPEDAHRFMDFAIEAGAGKVSFITADPVNPWIAERRVGFDEVLRPDDPSLLFTRQYRDFDWCRCHDGVYASPDGRLIEFYGRMTQAGGCDYCRGLVIEPDGTLRAGFNGPVILAGT